MIEHADKLDASSRFLVDTPRFGHAFAPCRCSPPTYPTSYPPPEGGAYCELAAPVLGCFESAEFEEEGARAEYSASERTGTSEGVIWRTEKGQEEGRGRTADSALCRERRGKEGGQRTLVALLPLSSVLQRTNKICLALNGTLHTRRPHSSASIQPSTASPSSTWHSQRDPEETEPLPALEWLERVVAAARALEGPVGGGGGVRFESCDENEDVSGERGRGRVERTWCRVRRRGGCRRTWQRAKRSEREK